MDKGDMGGPAANNSSDFVRKLYKMLEDPSYDAIVRWGEGGESFVVLENEKFTKNILPKHFKHSNFASFVRQLNKYDFHKVRQNNEDNTPSPYGPNAWEFKHPEFQANKKDSLDNIRRKAPAPRKPAQAIEEGGYPAQQMDLVNSQLMATQQQLQGLSKMYQDLAHGHVVLLKEMVQLQKHAKNHENVLQLVLNAARKNSATEGQFGSSSSMNAMLNPDGDHPASPIQQALDLLRELPANDLLNKELEQMTQEYSMRNDYSTPPNDQTIGMSLPSESTNSHPGYPIHDLDNMVYPVGQTNGIDPVNSEHIHNIPYSLPSTGMMPLDPMADMTTQTSLGNSMNRKKNTIESVWGINKPRILLVEDDKVCARIGSKFLQAFECGVETAKDGLEAVNKINNGAGQFDLILMDIIMPHLDGVSATVCIREIRPLLPIIAMTSNIRADDIDMYFRYGMNDVLPKPFTKDGMRRALEKHLPEFRKDAQIAAGQIPHPLVGPGYTSASQMTAGMNQTHQPLNLNMGQLSATQSLKGEASPGKSPATASSWQSPVQLPTQSPLGGAPTNFMQQPTYGMTPMNAQTMSSQPGFPGGPNPMVPVTRGGQQAHRRGPSDITGTPDDLTDPNKRQRMYPSGQNNFSGHQ